MEGTLITIVVLAVLAAIAVVAVKKYRKNLKEGCCASGDAGPGASVTASDTDESHYPYRTVMKISGMSCENCAKRIENALNRTEGVYGKVDLSQNSAEVLSKFEHPDRRLRLIVTELGYTVDSLNTAENETYKEN